MPGALFTIELKGRAICVVRAHDWPEAQVLGGMMLWLLMHPPDDGGGSQTPSHDEIVSLARRLRARRPTDRERWRYAADGARRLAVVL